MNNLDNLIKEIENKIKDIKADVYNNENYNIGLDEAFNWVLNELKKIEYSEKSNVNYGICGCSVYTLDGKN